MRGVRTVSVLHLILTGPPQDEVFITLIVDSGESNQQCQRITHRNCQTHFNSFSANSDNGAAIPPKTNMLIPINADAVPDSCVPTALIASAPPTVLMPLQNAMVKNNATSAGMGNCTHAHKTVSNAQNCRYQATSQQYHRS